VSGGRRGAIDRSWSEAAAALWRDRTKERLEEEEALERVILFAVTEVPLLLIIDVI
jgi:hypothetical protein